MRLAVLIGAALLSGCGGTPTAEPTVRVEIHRADAQPDSLPSPGPALPADVVAFRLKRDECDHLRGEAPTGPARAAFLKYGMERTCTGTDAALRTLRQRHGHDPAVIAALAGYDVDIE